MIYFYFRLKKKKKINLLKKNPQKKGLILKVKVMTPRKPNSGKRPIVKVSLSNKKLLIAHIPGIGHNLKQYSNSLINGKRTRDLPSVYYSCIRGVLDLNKVFYKTKRKSIYGIKTEINQKKKLRRKFRNL